MSTSAFTEALSNVASDVRIWTLCVSMSQLIAIASALRS